MYQNWHQEQKFVLNQPIYNNNEYLSNGMYALRVGLVTTIQ